MNKKVLIILGVILIVLVVCIILFKKNKISSKELVLPYKANAGVPFRWEYQIDDESMVELVKSYVAKDENTGGKVGAPIITNYVFKGKKEGETSVTFKYINFTDGSIWKKEKNIIKVDNNMDISLLSTTEDRTYTIEEAQNLLYYYFNREEGINFNYLETVEVKKEDKSVSYYKFDVRRHNEVVNSRLDIYYVSMDIEDFYIYDSEMFNDEFGEDK